MTHTIHHADPRVASTGSAVVPPSGPWHILARVSTGSRRELLAHVDTALTPHLDRAEVASIYQNARRPGVLARGKAGIAARRALGWETVYAPDTKRELGVLARAGDVTVLFINSSASTRDLVQNQNSLVAILEGLLSDPAFRGYDPHAPAAARPQVFAPYADRFIRDHELGWRLFNAARAAYAVFNIASKGPLDTLADDAETTWMLYAWEGAGSKKSTVSRLTNGELNLYRAGLHGGQEENLLRGYRWEHEPTVDGRWRRASDTTPKTLIAHYPEPDPEAWWEVETIMRVADDDEVTTWSDLATRLGRAGLTSRGKDETGLALDQLSDLASAAKLLLHPDKLRAYVTGSLPYQRVGPGDGMWTLPGGHTFEPRWHGDTKGLIRYTVQLGLPGWPTGFDEPQVERIINKWWPDGAPKRDQPGTGGTDTARRPLAGIVAWADDTHRYEMFAHSGRYELRSQVLDTARRRRDGDIADMRHEDSDLVASWHEAELAGIVATFLDDAIETFLTAHPDAEIAAHVPSRPAPARPEADSIRTHRAKIVDMVAAADAAAKQAKGANELANILAADGDTDTAREKLREAQALLEREQQLRSEADALRTAVPVATSVPQQTTIIDIGTPAAVVAALTGKLSSGPQPVELNTALHGLLGSGDNLRFEQVDGSATTMRMTGQVRLELADQTRHAIPHTIVVPAKIATTDATARINELAHQYMWEGVDLETLAVRARTRSPEVLRRQITEYVGAGERRPNPDPATRTARPFLAQGVHIADPGHRRAAVTGLLDLRRVLWASLTDLSLPKGLPAGYARHIRTCYTPAPEETPRTWYGDWIRPQPLRYQALAVLDSLPSLRRLGMRADHLAACLDVPPRNINDISRTWAHRTRQDPPTLDRAGDWANRPGDQLPPEEKLVRPIPCKHKGDGGRACPGLVTAVLFTPEVLATGAGALCAVCRRPPGSKQRFPESYLVVGQAMLNQHEGEWVPCGYVGCRVDFGAGPGLMWRWTTGPETVWHGPDCRANRASEPPAPRLQHCAAPDCAVDEGYGPGVIANRGRVTRRWHGEECHQAHSRHRTQARVERAARPCALPGCQIDEGAGAGMLNPQSRPARRWHDYSCRIAAKRLEGGAPAGTITWTQCGHHACTRDDGGGPGQIGQVAGAIGRPRRYHDPECARRARKEPAPGL